VVLKLLNGLLLVATLSYSAYLASDASDGAAMFAEWLGGSLWGLAPLLTLLASRRRAGRGIRRAAYAMNALTVVGLLLFAFGIDDRQALIDHFVGVAIISVPIAFNCYALWRLARPLPLNLELVEDTQASTIVEGPAASPAVRPTLGMGDLKSTNYFVRHWRGELSLPVSYWVNGSLLGLLAAAIMVGVEEVAQDWSLQLASGVSILVMVLVLVQSLWAMVGSWRSAIQHPHRGGSHGWAGTAKVMVVLSALGYTSTLFNNVLPQLKELTLIATGNDPIGEIDVTISSNGQAIILTGYFGEGSARKVRHVLDAAPAVRTVMLDSGGSRLKEAEDVARLVSARELNTYVESHCESVCTYVFLAGADRAATPNALIGFHRPTFPGVDSMTEYEMLQDMVARYVAAGISRDFIGKLAATPADDMWYPTYDELVANGVVNRLSTGGEVATLATIGVTRTQADFVRVMHQIPLFAAYERHFPGTIDAAAAEALSVQSSGGTDAEIMSAARAVLASRLPEVLAAASTEQLRTSAELTVDELKAARAVADEACGLLLSSQLDITKVFPPELVQRELDWTLDVLKGPMIPRAPVDAAAFDAALEPLLEILPAEQLVALGYPEAFADQPGFMCEATLNLYQAALVMPEPDRSFLLRGMFDPE